MGKSQAIELAIAHVTILLAAHALKQACPRQLFDEDGAPREACVDYPIPLWLLLTLAGLLAVFMVRSIRTVA